MSLKKFFAQAFDLHLCYSAAFFLVMLLYQIVAIYQHSSLGVSTTKDVISMIVLVLLLALAFAGRSYFPANDTVKIKLPERKPKQPKPLKQSKKLFKTPAQPVVQQPEQQPVPAQESKKSGRFKPGLVSDNPEQDLQNLIGLSAVKKRILEIQAVLAYDQEMGIQNEKQSYNMMFFRCSRYRQDDCSPNCRRYFV